MDITIIIKIAGIGLLVGVINQILSKCGKEEYGMLVTLSGITIVVVFLANELSSLRDTIRGLFGI